MTRQAEWFLGTQQVLSWELCDFSVHMGFCFYPMTRGNEGRGCWKIMQFPTCPFSTDFYTGRGIIRCLEVLEETFVTAVVYTCATTFVYPFLSDSLIDFKNSPYMQLCVCIWQITLPQKSMGELCPLGQFFCPVLHKECSIFIEINLDVPWVFTTFNHSHWLQHLSKNDNCGINARMRDCFLKLHLLTCWFWCRNSTQPLTGLN